MEDLTPKIKLSARYLVLVYFMYLAYELVQPEYANKIKDVGEVAVSAIYGSVFGALTLIIRGHFTTVIDKGKSTDDVK